MATSHDVVFIRSIDRGFGSSQSHTINLPSAYKNIYSLQLLSAEVPMQFYAIPTSYASGVTFTNGSTIAAFSINPGNYTISDLQPLLLAWLQATYAGNGVTAVNFDSISGKLSVHFNTGSLSVNSTAIGKLGVVLGTSSSATASVSQVLTFPNVANVYPITSIFINVTNLVSNVFSTGGFNAMFRIQFNVQPGGILFVNNGTNVYNTVNFATPLSNLSQLAVQIVDQNNTALNMNGGEWQWSLGISYA